MTTWKNVVPWEAITVPSEGKGLEAILADLDVEGAPRYKAKDGKTFCNIFVTDVVKAMGVRGPRHWHLSDGGEAKMGQGIEMSANRMHAWFRKHGAVYGWWEVDQGTAEAAAERGHLVVCSWPSDGRREPGHVAILLGEDRITQAGKNNYESCSIKAGFGNRPVSFWVQVERAGGHQG